VSRVDLHGEQNKTVIVSKLQSTRHYHHLINPHTRYSAARLLRVPLLTLMTSNNRCLNSQGKGNEGGDGSGEGNCVGDDGGNCKEDGDGNCCGAFGDYGSGCGISNATTNSTKTTTTT
jgi:hypothetical protein